MNTNDHFSDLCIFFIQFHPFSLFIGLKEIKSREKIILFSRLWFNMSQLSKNSKFKVRQSNALTSAAYSLSRNAKRVIYLALNVLSDREQLKFCKTEHGFIVDIAHKQFSDVYSDPNPSRNIHKAAIELREKAIRIFLPDEDSDTEKALKERVWCVAFDHLPKQNLTRLYFNSSVVEMIPYKKGVPYTQYFLMGVAKIDNPYSMRLFESICQWIELKSEMKFAVEWIISRFGLPASYARMSDFRAKFLKVALKEINAQSHITGFKLLPPIELCEGSRSNTVTHIRFMWEKVPIQSLEQATHKQGLNGLELAVAIYVDLFERNRLPTQVEINHLKEYLIQLGIEGFDLGGGFFDKLRAAEAELVKLS